jgi:hypothetical protein
MAFHGGAGGWNQTLGAQIIGAALGWKDDIRKNSAAAEQIEHHHCSEIGSPLDLYPAGSSERFCILCGHSTIRSLGADQIPVVALLSVGRSANRPRVVSEAESPVLFKA